MNSRIFRGSFFFLFLFVLLGSVFAANIGYWGGDVLIDGTKVNDSYVVSVWADNTKIREDTLGAGPESPADMYLLVVEEDEGDGKDISFKIKADGKADNCALATNLADQVWSTGAHKLNLTFSKEPSCPTPSGGGGSGSPAYVGEIFNWTDTSVPEEFNLTSSDRVTFNHGGEESYIKLIQVSDGNASFSVSGENVWVADGDSFGIDIDGDGEDDVTFSVQIDGAKVKLALKSTYVAPVEEPEPEVKPEPEPEKELEVEPETQPEPEPKKGFWQRLVDWFKALFGF